MNVAFESPSKVLLTLSWKDELSSKAWSFPFRLEYSIELSEESGGSLITSLRIMNLGLLGAEPFEYHCLQHTYLSVPDIPRNCIGSGEGSGLINQLAKGEIQHPETDALPVDKEVDWIFFGNPATPQQETVVALGDGNAVHVKRSYSVASKHVACDVVTWNPWVEKSKKRRRFWRRRVQDMICIEPGNVSRKDTIRGEKTLC